MKALLKEHGHLDWLQDEYPPWGRFCTYTYACRRCGSRWLAIELRDPPFYELRQESADGHYYCTTDETYVAGKLVEFGRYVDGKKHGLFKYYRYPRHRSEIDRLVLGDLWNHGRLVEWHEYGPCVMNARGGIDFPVVRSWHAQRKTAKPRKTKRTTRSETKE